MSAYFVIFYRFLVLSFQTVTIASIWRSNDANGDPTTSEFPTITTFFPITEGKIDCIIRIQLFTVHGINIFFYNPLMNKSNNITR